MGQSQGKVEPFGANGRHVEGAPRMSGHDGNPAPRKKRTSFATEDEIFVIPSNNGKLIAQGGGNQKKDAKSNNTIQPEEAVTGPTHTPQTAQIPGEASPPSEEHSSSMPVSSEASDPRSRKVDAKESVQEQQGENDENEKNKGKDKGQEKGKENSFPVPQDPAVIQSFPRPGTRVKVVTDFPVDQSYITRVTGALTKHEGAFEMIEERLDPFWAEVMEITDVEIKYEEQMDPATRETKPQIKEGTALSPEDLKYLGQKYRFPPRIQYEIPVDSKERVDARFDALPPRDPSVPDDPYGDPTLLSESEPYGTSEMSCDTDVDGMSAEKEIFRRLEDTFEREERQHLQELEEQRHLEQIRQYQRETQGTSNVKTGLNRTTSPVSPRAVLPRYRESASSRKPSPYRSGVEGKQPLAKAESAVKFHSWVPPAMRDAKLLAKSISNMKDSTEDVITKVVRIINMTRSQRRTMLDLSKMGLRYLPNDLWQASFIQSLILQDNALTFLPHFFGDYMPNIEYFDLQRNQLTSLPKSFHGLQCLTQLMLQNNAIKSIPEEAFQGLPKVHTVMLCQNQLRALPASLFTVPLVVFKAEQNTIVHLPETVSQCTTLEELHLNQNTILSIPSLERLQNLKILHLDDNSLPSLPPGLDQVPSLRSLRMTSNGIESIGSEWCKFPNLCDLYLGQNKLSSIPDCIGELKHLRTLALNENRLTELPTSFCKLTNLRLLMLSENNLLSLPRDFGNLENLNTLHLDHNELEKLPSSFSQLSSMKRLRINNNRIMIVVDMPFANLEYFHCHNNQFAVVPPTVMKMSAMDELTISGNKLINIPTSIKNLSLLTSLLMESNELQDEGIPRELASYIPLLRKTNMSQNCLKNFPYGLCHMKHLTTVELQDNQISKIPDEIVHLKPTLRTLVLGNNLLDELPGFMFELTNLRILRLDNNNISVLPDEVRHLTLLQELDLNKNKLNTLPDSIGALTGLWILKLAHNNISTIPTSLTNTRLNILDITGNPLDADHRITCIEGLTALKFYLTVQ